MTEAGRNYLTEANGAVVVSVTSQQSEARSVLLDREDVSCRQKFWLSGDGLPQVITFGIGRLKERPAMLKCFGWTCKKAYPANPALIEVSASVDGQTYEKLGSLPGRELAGPQLHPIKPLFKRFSYLQVSILRTFNSSQAYISQVYLMEDLPRESVSPESDLRALLSKEINGDPLPPRYCLPRSKSAAGGNPVTPTPKKDSDLSALQETIKGLCEQVKGLQSQLAGRQTGDPLQEIKRELLMELEQAGSPDFPPNSDTDFCRVWQERVLEPRLAKFEAHILSLVGGGQESRGSRHVRGNAAPRTAADHRYRESESFL